MSGLDLADPDDSSDNLHVQISILILWDCSLSRQLIPSRRPSLLFMILSPVTIQFKMLFQDICTARLTWDEMLSGELLTLNPSCAPIGYIRVGAHAQNLHVFVHWSSA